LALRERKYNHFTKLPSQPRASHRTFYILKPIQKQELVVF
jgi:hypothetical protein